MFPTSHDLFMENVEEACEVLRKMLEAGNEVLITTKPRLDVIKYIIFDLALHEIPRRRELILFRFTITSSKDETLQFWEPNAPLFKERMNALIYAHRKDYRTSVSIEPYLDDPLDVWAMIRGGLEHYVTDTIWVGPMNRKFCPPELWQENLWGPEAIRNLHQELMSDECLDKDKLRFKDSFREALA